MTNLLAIFMGVLSVAFASLELPSQIVYFMQVSSPQSLSYAYELMMARDIGRSFVGRLDDVELVYAHPNEACEPLGANVRGKVVLAERGECSFITKAYNAEQAHAIALIVTQSDTDDDAIVEMIADAQSTLAVRIPTAFLTGKDGRMFRRHFEYSDGRHPIIVTLPLNLTNTHLHNVTVARMTASPQEWVIAQATKCGGDDAEAESWLLLAGTMRNADDVKVNMASLTMHLGNGNAVQAAASLDGIVDALRTQHNTPFWDTTVVGLVDRAFEEEDIHSKLFAHLSDTNHEYLLRTFIDKHTDWSTVLRAHVIYCRRHQCHDPLLKSFMTSAFSHGTSKGQSEEDNCIVVVDMAQFVFKHCAARLKDAVVTAEHLNWLCLLSARFIVSALLAKDTKKWAATLTESSCLLRRIVAYTSFPSVFTQLHRAHTAMSKTRRWTLTANEFGTMSSLCTYVNGLQSSVERKVTHDSLSMCIAPLTALLCHYNKQSTQQDGEECLVLLDDTVGLETPSSAAVPMKKRKYEAGGGAGKVSIFVRGVVNKPMCDVYACGARMAIVLEALTAGGKCAMWNALGEEATTCAYVKQFVSDCYIHSGKYAELTAVTDVDSEASIVQYMRCICAMVHQGKYDDAIECAVKCVQLIPKEGMASQLDSVTWSPSAHYALLTASHALVYVCRVLRTILRRRLQTRDMADSDTELAALIILSQMDVAEDDNEEITAGTQFSREWLSGEVVKKGGLQYAHLLTYITDDVFWLSQISYWHVSKKLKLLICPDTSGKHHGTRGATKSSAKDIQEALRSAIRVICRENVNGCCARFIVEHAIDIVE